MQNIFEFFFSMESGNRIGSLINLAILGLLASGIVSYWRAIGRITAEFAGLNAFKSRLTQNPTAATVLNDVTMAAGPASLLGQRAAMLGDLHRAGVDPDVVTLSAVAAVEIEGDGSWARWAAGTSILLGLAGTLVGLSISVDRAMPMIQGILNSEDAIKAVTEAFSGLGTAFSTTLTGIFASVTLGIANMSLRRNQTRFMSALEQVCLLRVYPYFRTSPAQALVQAALMLTKLEQQLQTSMSAIIGQLQMQGLALTKVVGDSVGQLVIDVRAAGKALHQSMGGMKQELSDRGQALTAMVDKSFTTLTDELRDGTGSLLQRIEQTHRALHQLLGDPGADAVSITASLKALNDGVVAIEKSAERLSKMAPVLEEGIARQIDRQSRDLHDTMHSYTGRLADSAQRAEVAQGEGMRRIEAAVSSFGDTALAVLKEHDATLLNGLHAEIAEFGKSLLDSTEAVRELSTAAKELRTATEKLDASGSNGARPGVAEGVATGMKETLAALHRIGASLNGLTTRLEQRGGVMPPHFTTPGNVTPGHDAQGPLAATAGVPNKKSGFFSRLFGR